jgi:hypothetical protein
LTALAVQKICSHQQFQSNFRRDGKLGDFGGAIGIPVENKKIKGKLKQNFKSSKEELSKYSLPVFVVEILTDFGENMRPKKENW